MGQVDSTLKYGIYHSYQLMPNDWVYATIFDVQYLSHITAQCVVIKPAGDIAEGRFEVRWIDADGRPIGGTSKKYFTPTRLWKRHTATFEVPENAIKARVHYEGGTQGYHFACAMVEPGEIASAFSFEVASRLVYITNEGAYLGLLNAGQIVTGKMLSPTGKMWVDLDKPEIVMKGTDADLYIDPSNPLKVTDKSNNFVGGIIKVDNEIFLAAEAITNADTPDFMMRTGEIQEGPYWINGINLFYKDEATGEWRSAIALAGNPSGTPNRWARIYGPSDRAWIEFYDYHEANSGKIDLHSKYSYVSTDEDGAVHIGALDEESDGYNTAYESRIELVGQGNDYQGNPQTRIYMWCGVQDGREYGSFLINESGALIARTDSNNVVSGKFGIDDNGPYAIRKNGTKIYL